MTQLLPRRAFGCESQPAPVCRQLIRERGYGGHFVHDIRIRSEVDVYLGEDGLEVTTPYPQQEAFFLPERWRLPQGSCCRRPS